MSIRIKKFGYNEKELFKIAHNIRDDVFIKEQNVPKKIEFDGQDDDATHYLIFDDITPVATARWRITDNGIKLERFAVIKSYRNKGYGNLILTEILADVKPYEKTIYLNAQTEAIHFYERHGFVKQGDEFLEADIKHYQMIFVESENYMIN